MLMAMVACQSTTSYVKDFTQFIEEVREECAEYDEADWENADKKFADLTEKQFKKFVEELTIEQRATIIQLKGTYSALRVQGSLKGVGNELEKAGKQLENFFKGKED